jgi:hypothetical protein
MGAIWDGSKKKEATVGGDHGRGFIIWGLPRFHQELFTTGNHIYRIMVLNF